MILALAFAASYRLVDLHVNPDSGSLPLLNDRGTVMGTAISPGQAGVFVYWHGRRQFLPTYVSKTLGLNNRDEAVLSTETGPARWHDGKISLLSTGGHGDPIGIDDAGNIVSAYLESGRRPAYWRTPTPLKVDLHGLRPSVIGPDGSLCLTKPTELWPTQPKVGPIAFLCYGTNLTPIGGQDDLLAPLCMSSNDRVGGSGAIGGQECETPFVWQAGDLTILPRHKGQKSNARVYGVNSSGLAVGVAIYREVLDGATTQRVRAVMWKNKKLIDLNDFVPASFPFTLTMGVAINDRGEILTEAEVKDVAHFQSPTLVLLEPTGP